MSLLRKLTVPILFLAISSGCDSERITTEYNGYGCTIDRIPGRRDIYLRDDKNKSPHMIIPCLTAVDSDADGRFDQIILTHVPKGHSLERYASIQAIEQVYQEVLSSQTKK